MSIRRTSRIRSFLAFAAASAAVAAFPGPAGAQTLTIDGNPLDVSVSDDGNLQAQLEGATTSLFHPSGIPEGDAGLWIGFPAAVGSIPAGSVAGPDAEAFPNDVAPNEDVFYQTVSQSPTVSGDGSSGNPYQVNTVYRVLDGATPVLNITQEIRHQTGTRLFRARYLVKNVYTAPVRFRATAAADLYLEGSNSGHGFYSAGPPEFVGAFGEVSGPSAPASAAGGMREVATSPWSAFQEGDYLADIWTGIDEVVGVEPTPAGGLDNRVEPNLVDNGVGVQWDDRYSTALPINLIQEYQVVYVIGTPSPPTTPPFTPPVVVPPPDSDGDGVPDESDPCPVFPAATPTGCPIGAKTAVKSFTAAIRKAVGRLSIAKLTQKTSISVPFKAPGAGKLDVTGKAKLKLKGGAVKSVVLFKGKQLFKNPKTAKVPLKLTKPGKALLKKAVGGRVAFKQAFKDAAGRTFKASVTVKLKPRPKARIRKRSPRRRAS